MNYTQIVKNELRSNYKNKIIYASKVYKEKFENIGITEASFYQTLERMFKNKEINKVSKGVYRFVKENQFGPIPVSEEELIHNYIKNNKGMFVGYSIYQQYKITTQVPKKIFLYSSNLDGETKNLKNIQIRRVNISFNEHNVKNIEMLEILENFNKIEEINLKSFYKYAENFSNTYNERSLKKVLSIMKYKKSTIAFLRDILEFFEVENTLSSYLSSLSKYKYMKMKEIYEISNE